MDDAATRFTIVFEKLEEVSTEFENSSGPGLIEEAEEIAELRRIVLEVTEPPAPTYTTT